MLDRVLVPAGLVLEFLGRQLLGRVRIAAILALIAARLHHVAGLVHRILGPFEDAAEDLRLFDLFLERVRFVRDAFLGVDIRFHCIQEPVGPRLFLQELFLESAHPVIERRLAIVIRFQLIVNFDEQLAS